MSKIKKNLLLFLNKHVPTEKKILLGYSGGPDSTLLFHLLKEEKIPFGAAYIDHGWREESRKEQELIKEQCNALGVPCYTCRLNKGALQNNLEEEGRKARYTFFKQVCDENGYGGVMVGHHADDQAETVLKRVFEGATLRRLKGLAAVSCLDNLLIWRPLLPFRKEEILQEIDERRVSYFKDATNEDARFLRSRMRLELLPALSETFGKKISPSLCRLGNSASELDEFLEHFLISYREKVSKTDGRIEIDLSSYDIRTVFEWKLIVHDFFEKQKLSIASSVVETIVHHLKKRSSHKKIYASKREIEIHKGKISILLETHQTTDSL